MANSLESLDETNIEGQEGVTFEKASREIRENGYSFHEQAHDRGGRDPKIYHVSEHPRTLERRAEQMADVLSLSPEQRALIMMAIAWHDTVIEYDKADPDNLFAMISRHRGARVGDKPNGIEGNEAKSASLLEQEMRQANELAEREVFTEEQISIARWAIEATYPDVNLGPDFKGAIFEDYPYYEIAANQNPDLGTLFNELKAQGIIAGPLFFQPHLEKSLEEGAKVPREVLIVALSDLGATGLSEEKTFFKEGDDEMRELYANLRKPEVMRRLTESDDETARVDRERITEAFMAWLHSQTGFAMWQALRFEKILYLLKQQNGIAPTEEHGLRLQFSHFIDNIRATRQRYEKLNKEMKEIKSTQGERAAFSYLAQNLHYEIQ